MAKVLYIYIYIDYIYKDYSIVDNFRMLKRKSVSMAIRNLAIDKANENMSYSEIADMLHLPKSTVGYIVKKWKNGKGVKDLPRSGAPKKTTAREDKLIIRKSTSDPNKDAVQICTEMSAEYGLKVSANTIRRRLDAAGLSARVPVKKPLIRTKNRRIRLNFAKEHESWTTSDWKKVLWSDESKFNLFGSDGRRYIRRPKDARFEPRYQRPTMKHGGGCVQVWGSFHHGGVGPLVHIDGIMDQKVYKDILEDHMLPFARSNMPRGWIFQQDNDPKHTSKYVKQWFQCKKVQTLEWPSQSPDLNPIENLWDDIGRKVGQTKHSSKADLLQDLKSYWSQIPKATLESLIDSMPRRCSAVIKSKGYATKY